MVAKKATRTVTKKAWGILRADDTLIAYADSNRCYAVELASKDERVVRVTLSTELPAKKAAKK
jgi:hypothetical protein